MARSTALRDAIKKRFYPLVERKGFVRVHASNYFTEFRRLHAGRVDVFDVQWEKHWRPLFVLNFGQSPAGAAGDKISTTEVDRSQLNRTGRLQRRRGGSLGCWFGLRRPWLNVLTSGRWAYTIDEVVDELIDAFDEFEAWWNDGSEGPHIYIWRIAA